jgi:hypothetical protein
VAGVQAIQLGVSSDQLQATYSNNAALVAANASNNATAASMNAANNTAMNYANVINNVLPLELAYSQGSGALVGLPGDLGNIGVSMGWGVNPASSPQAYAAQGYSTAQIQQIFGGMMYP